MNRIDHEYALDRRYRQYQAELDAFDKEQKSAGMQLYLGIGIVLVCLIFGGIVGWSGCYYYMRHDLGEGYRLGRDEAYRQLGVAVDGNSFRINSGGCITLPESWQTDCPFPNNPAPKP
jgi:hypothetical protein